MNAQQLIPKHQHGSTAIELVDVKIMLTDDHQLLLRGTCPACHIQVDCASTLDECWKMCPAPSEGKFTINDIRFLHSLKVGLPKTP